MATKKVGVCITINDRYSCIAGFLEPGESLEEASQREVLEETGVQISQCNYHSSQPWPFPSQLMLGVSAKAISTEIDTTSRDMELEGTENHIFLMGIYKFF